MAHPAVTRDSWEKPPLIRCPRLWPARGEPWAAFFLRLCHVWAEFSLQHHQESPVLGVRAVGPQALEVRLWNSTRWIVPRGQRKAAQN